MRGNFPSSEFVGAQLGRDRNQRRKNRTAMKTSSRIGRIKAQRIATPVTTSVVFDKHSNQIQMIDGKGKSVFAKYDPLDRNYLTTDRINAETNTRYDQNSNTLAITDGEDSTTTYEYDVRDLKVKIIHPDHINGSNFGDPNNGIELFEYDAASRTIRVTDQNGDTKTSNWDMANRLLSEDYRTLANSPSGTISDSDTFEYDDAGRVIKATSGRYSNVVEATFDEAGRSKTESLIVGGNTYTSTRNYDEANRNIELIYPDGSVVERTFTNRNQLQTVLLNTNLIHTRTYDNGGRLATTVHGNGVTSTFGYRNDNLLASINTPTASGATHAVGNYSYDWDENKNKISETITGTLANYGFGASGSTVYDDEDRLTTWNRVDGNLNRSWNLSPVGDWNTLTVNGLAEDRTHNEVHEIVTIGTHNLTHDVKGNLTQASDGRQFAWDMDNKLVSATVPAGAAGIEGTHSYTYDALGRRVSKTVDDATANGGAGVTTTTLFVYSGQQVILEYTVPTAGSPTVASPDRKFVYGSYIDEPILISRASSVTPGTYLNFYYSRNQQYSITALTDAAGEVIERYAYTDHGTTTIFTAAGSAISNSQISNPYTYTARRSDPETGLMYFRARMYAPTLGRFISRDPLGFVDGMSLYRGYFAVAGMDPQGLRQIKIVIAAFINGNDGSKLSEIFPDFDTIVFKSKVGSTVTGALLANSTWFKSPAPHHHGLAVAWYWASSSLYFRTDSRDKYQAGTSRARHTITFDTNNAGNMVGKASVVFENDPTFGVFRWYDSSDGKDGRVKEAKSQFKAVANRWPLSGEVGDTWDGYSQIRGSASGSDPLALGAPSLDYDFVIDVRKCRGERGGTDVRLIFTHDKFPDYEVMVDDGGKYHFRGDGSILAGGFGLMSSNGNESIDLGHFE